MHDALSLVCGSEEVVNPYENVWIHVVGGANGKSAVMMDAAALNAALEISSNRQLATYAEAGVGVQEIDAQESDFT